MKNIKLTIVFAALLIAIGTIVSITWKLGISYLSYKKPTVLINKCEQKSQKHTIDIKNDNPIPTHITGKLCDVLTITNLDNAVRLMAFGPHDSHITYDGITEKYLDKGQSLTITLNQVGTFEFHDHIGDIVKGNFTVTN